MECMEERKNAMQSDRREGRKRREKDMGRNRERKREKRRRSHTVPVCSDGNWQLLSFQLIKILEHGSNFSHFRKHINHRTVVTKNQRPCLSSFVYYLPSSILLLYLLSSLSPLVSSPCPPLLLSFLLPPLLVDPSSCDTNSRSSLPPPL